MAIEREKFFEIINEVSDSKDLSSDNVLKKVRDKLKEKSDENGIDSPYTIVYNIFKSHSFYKNYEFKLQMPDGTTARGTLLHFAVQCGNALMVKLLLENKVSATMKDHSGLTPWDIATSNSNQEIKQLLLDAKANLKLEKNKDKTPEDLVVNRNNATAALESFNKRTSFDESSDSTVDEQRQSVKDMIKNFELPQRRNTTCSGKQTSTSLNESGNSDDSGICTESEDGEDTDAKNEELKKLEKELAESKSCIAEHETTLEALKKQNQKESESLKQKIQDLKSKNTTLNSELEKTKTKTNEVPLEKAQKELTELRSYFTGHGARLDTLNEENESLKQKMQDLGNENTKLKGELEKIKNQHSNDLTEHKTKLKEFNKENESLKQKIKSLENENTTLKGTTKTKTDEVSLEKVGKRQFSPKVAYASLAAMLVVGAALSIASGLSVLPIIVIFVASALIASGVTYAISTKPTTELKEVDIQGSAQRCL